MPSFDIVSQVNSMEIENAVNTAKKELANRFDFKGTKAEIALEKNEIKLSAESLFKLRTLTEIVIVEPKVFGDERGYFFETWHSARYGAAGLPSAFVQDNLSYSLRGVLRGLHFQNPYAQGKLLSVLQGEVFDVAVDTPQVCLLFHEIALGGFYYHPDQHKR